AGKVIGPAVPAVYRKHEITDIPAKGRAAEDGRLTHHAGERKPVFRTGGSCAQFPGEKSDDQTAPHPAAVVKGAHLAPHGDRVPAVERTAFQKGMRSQYIDAVLGARDA